ncbi:MAG TPA: hypothetical protein VMV72_09530 [Verrucomicrobiae bacterium]|nr:hypothetical protein [Verrucomicrobiae bacterium]
MSTVFRGTRKHILDWTGQGREAFARSLNEMIQPANAHVGSDDSWIPQGYRFPNEAKLSQVGDLYLSERIRGVIDNWWLKHKKGTSVPGWDLLATGDFEGKKGLILVQGASHANELGVEGRDIRGNASAHSKANHKHIGAAIEMARKALAGKFSGVEISRDNHYELSTRVALAWKLAWEGVPVILLYLGFIGDEGVSDLGEPFRSSEQWYAFMKEHIRGVLPPGLIGKPIKTKGADMTILLAARNVNSISPSPTVSTSVAFVP